jgi:hypothetical protein
MRFCNMSYVKLDVVFLEIVLLEIKMKDFNFFLILYTLFVT